MKKLISLLIVFIVSACASSQVTEDGQLSSYVIGKWHSVEVIKDDKPFDLKYKIIFESDSIVKLIVMDSLITGEGYTFDYKFINQDTIQVDNPRSLPEIWILKRQENNLIIYRTVNDSTITMTLERSK